MFERQAEKEEERRLEELKRIQIAAGLIPKTSLDRLDWMYQIPHGQAIETSSIANDSAPLVGCSCECLLIALHSHSLCSFCQPGFTAAPTPGAGGTSSTSSVSSVYTPPAHALWGEYQPVDYQKRKEQEAAAVSRAKAMEAEAKRQVASAKMQHVQQWVCICFVCTLLLCLFGALLNIFLCVCVFRWMCLRRPTSCVKFERRSKLLHKRFLLLAKLQRLCLFLLPSFRNLIVHNHDAILRLSATSSSPSKAQKP